jgi:hypothetical protein
MLEITLTNKKDFMNKLLCSDCFDDFLLTEAVISVRTTHTIDGHFNQGYYEKDEWEDPSIRPFDYISWADIRPQCFDLIKGKRTPASLKFILCCKPSVRDVIISGHIPGKSSGVTAISGSGSDAIDLLVIRILFHDDIMSLTTGVSYNSFVPSHDAEHAFDDWICAFLKEKNIDFDIAD